MSATLEANERIQARIAAGRPVLHLAFGEAGLPVHPALAEVLAGAAHRNGYGAVAGSPELREAVAGYLGRRRLPTDPALVVAAPGSKPLLFALLTLLEGDVVVPQPAWVSYGAQARLGGKRLIRVPAPASSGGIPDPALLEAALDAARGEGAKPGILVLTLPDNPTGSVAPSSLLAAVCAVAAERGLAIVSDEIYRDLAYSQDGFHSPAEFLPERTVVTAGLSKSLALGGWRIGIARFPESAFGVAAARAVRGLASEVWSCLAAPMEEAAAYAFSEPEEIGIHIERSRRLHQRVAEAAHRVLLQAGAACRAPEGGFYLYPDLESRRPSLAAAGVTTGAGLAELLLERFEVGVLAGEAFGDQPAALRFRAATSLLYGATAEERWAALRSSDPAALPWIADSLRRLAETLAAL